MDFFPFGVTKVIMEFCLRDYTNTFMKYISELVGITNKKIKSKKKKWIIKPVSIILLNFLLTAKVLNEGNVLSKSCAF